MRGLKPANLVQRKQHHVASFTDAWIETNGTYPYTVAKASHLLQMRGLKLWKNRAIFDAKQVASFTDAWIETLVRYLSMV